ncbi:MAG: ammonia-forming cytochrome c nitrite reductase subunit c552 [Verrucomicrobiota bacterium]
MATFTPTAGAAQAALADVAAPQTASNPKGFAGSSSCRACHQHFYALWAPSHHGLAMQPFTQEFQRAWTGPKGTNLAIGTGRYRIDVDRGAMVETRPAGETAYRIEQAMGGKNVFYFLTPLDRGRLQVLPLAYDLRRQEWFDVAASAVRHFPSQTDAPFHWRDEPFTFNTACFNCHVSQLSNNYDLASDAYHSTWLEPGINCETCHGPGADHIQAARNAPKGEPLKDLKLIVTGQFSREQMNALCASCHSKMSPLTATFTPGDRFFDHFGLIGLEHPDFYPDGRDLGENFTETSWRLSRCAQSGQLDCTHCHSSSGRYKFTGAKANNACLPCHQSQVDRSAEHSRHRQGSEGDTCIACHMPTTEFARMRRSDHSMRPPMPAATLAHQSPNACNQCHRDQTAAWADRWVRQRQQSDYQAPLLEKAGWIASARQRDWTKLPDIVSYLRTSAREEVWAAALLQLLRPCDDNRKWGAALACLQDKSPLVRAAAVEVCGDRMRQDFVPALIVATKDSSRLVRLRAASALAAIPNEALPAADRSSVESAVTELKASFLVRPDDSASHYNLGNFHLERREYAAALAAFGHASRLQPRSVPPLVNAALAYDAIGKKDKAEDSLRRALRLDPTNAVANLNAGMLFAELDKPAEAEQAFRTAFASDPQSATAAYNLGVLLAGARPEEALGWCRRAAQLRPNEPRYGYTLAYFLVQRGGVKEAAAALEANLQSAPDHVESYALLGQVLLDEGRPADAAALYRRAAANPEIPADVRRQFTARADALTR